MSENQRYLIGDELLKQLNDPVKEKRVGALKEIRKFLKNNIFEQQTGEDELSIVSLHNLVRNLIRWFHYKPLTNEEDVLDLLIFILARREFLRHIVKFISVSRLKKEVAKIFSLNISQESHTKLQTINNLLCAYESSILIDVADQTGSFGEIDSPSHYSRASSLHDNLLLRRTSSASSMVITIDDDDDEFWERLEGLNLDTFNGLVAELSLHAEIDHLCNVLNFLKSSIDDYPPEFFLQPPNILEFLLNILLKVPKVQSIEIIRLIRFIVNKLKDRWVQFLKLRKSQEQSFVAVKKHMNKILLVITSYFEKIHNNFDIKSFIRSLEVLNEFYYLLFDIAVFMRETNNACEIYVNELMNMMAKVAKDLRLCYATAGEDSRLIRIHYMIFVYSINALVCSIDTQNISAYCENNVWEFESDVALLDGALKISKSKIYSLVRKNREEIIKDDKDLMLLLDAKESFKPVVKLFQNWEHLSDEGIIFTGLEALKTIRIHKSLELVDLLTKTIEKCSSKFNESKALKEAAEEIYLRLLSIESSKIKRRSYAIAHNYHQRNLIDEKPHETLQTLCSAVGFPLTTELITEILCFGFTNSNEDVQRSVRSILFGLFRSRVTFPKHSKEIAEIVKPIMPLTTCLFATDEKMGLFAFDMLQQHSVFDDFELNQNFARFLFCKAPKARLLAKKKILLNLKFDEELSEIVPDNFCILPQSDVQKLQLPNQNVGIDYDGYENLSQMLKNIQQSDSDTVQPVLLQLSVMMNSREMCQKSHDDNLWVVFMASLEMGHPENIIIRRHTINILLKWVVCIQSFRIYLANEPSILEFLIKSLVNFQDDPQIKKNASTLLFLLLFSDFIVTSERSVSMPKIIESLNCPFKFDYHWTESPFNKISALEQMNEAIESNEDAVDIREISKSFLKFEFSLEWFKEDETIITMKDFGGDLYYRGNNKNALRVIDSLQLTENDIKCVRQTVSKEILKDLCVELDNTTNMEHVQSLITQIRSLVIIPVSDENEFAEKVDHRIERFFEYSENNARQQRIFLGLLEIYMQILKYMEDTRIVNVFRKKFFEFIIMTNGLFVDETLIAAISFINSAILLCKQRPQLMKLLIKSFEQNQKVYLPSRLVERFSNQLFEEVMKDGKWHETGKRPVVRSILILIRNVLDIMPNQLDDKFLGELFDKFSKVLMPLYRSQHHHLKSSTKLHVHSSTLKSILSIMLRISSVSSRLKLSSEHYKVLTFWAFDDKHKFRAIPWLIIANLTTERENFEIFCKEYHEFMQETLVNSVFETLLTKKLSNLDQKSVVAVYANFLCHAPPHINLTFKIVDKLLQSNNISALCIVVEKMVQNNVPATEDLVKSRELMRKFLCFEPKKEIENYLQVTEQFETINLCFKHKPLKDFVIQAVTNDMTINFIAMLGNGDDHKKFNFSALKLLLIMMQSEAGMMKISRGLSNPLIVDKLIAASCEMMRTSNPFQEIMFILCFWKSLLDANCQFNCPAIDLISVHKLSKSVKDSVMSSANSKFANILEKEFGKARFAIDLVFLQVVSFFEYSHSSKFSLEYKNQMKTLCFVVIKTLTSSNDRVRQFSKEINLIFVAFEKLDLSLAILKTYRHLETTKKNGVQKCQLMIKDLCILLKALTEWSLPLHEHQNRVRDIFQNLLKVSDWLEADSVLMNCFLNLLQSVSVLEIGKKCVMEEVNGIPIVKGIFKKAQALSMKPPHTEINLKIIKNGILALQTCSRLVEVRLMLKNMKIFQMLEVLHPQIHKTRKSTWDDVTVTWLRFFEFLSRFSDTECLANHISLLCRLFRLGNQEIKNISLVIIRNFSLNSSIGYILLNSEDFKLTVDAILMDSSNTEEKILILQTLLSIASKGDQQKSKLKNSSLNRKLKDQLDIMKSDFEFQSNPENLKVMNLTIMLSQLLYPKE